LEKNYVDAAGAEGQDVASRFLKAVNNEDAQTFWSLLDKKGQGYFMGMWFLALANADIRTIEALTGESSFLTNTLRPIIQTLKSNLEDLLEAPSFGRVVHVDGHHAMVPLLSAIGDNTPGGEQGRIESIPLVLELAPADNANAALTCWKVDTFKCIQFGKDA